MTRAARRPARLAPLVVLAFLATACGDDEDSAEGELIVFAAASLTESFTAVGEAFAEAHPDAAPTFSFDASSTLVQQIANGAPADVFASADQVNMDKLTAAGAHGREPVVFATNVLAIVVAVGNPEGIGGVADLAEPDLDVVVCASEVPCGRYAAKVFDAAGVTVTPASLEQNVRGVMTKVTAGEADAGIVYTTDVIAAGDDAGMVTIPADVNVVAQYPIATLEGAENADVGAAFVEFLTGPDGQAILSQHGFGPP